MRTKITALFVLATACTQAADADALVPAPDRVARESLLAAAGKLRGHELTTRDEGGWTYRVTASPATVGAAATKAPTAERHGERLRRSIVTVGAEAMDARKPEGSPSAPSDSGAAFVGRVEADAPTSEAAGAAGSLATVHASGPGSAGPAPALRAGATDDNLAFDDYLTWLESECARVDVKDRVATVDVAGRTAVQVVDVDGAIVPGMALTIVDEQADRVVWRGTTYGDGRVPFYPGVAPAGGEGPADYLVEVAVGDRVVHHRWDGVGECTVRLPVQRREAEPLQLDVAFVLDTTGSMGDEIAAIKATLLEVTRRLRALGREFELRYGAVLYRDVGDEYVTAQHDFTADVEAFDELLRGVQANGGGDGPESLNQGLAVAIDGLGWRDGAAKVAFLIADAPPHLDYDNDVAYDQSLVAAVARGVRVHTVAASGLDRAGSVVFRQIAQFTRGEFVFIEYGGDLANSAAQHGVQRATGNNLDEILYTRIRDEIAGWGREVEAVADASATMAAEER